ncbi:ROK family transcriptional regulator [Leifsonia poae]|uniref:Sugar kinase n=1 Tax=Leifsonia poae TaxID=110933 RepID=A0A9W6H675_9MICO|nr:ROK family transcriptional regulator [Leifsonia poae]GLJ74659.1 sugar kinase [Leifsonia poae]
MNASDVPRTATTRDVTEINRTAILDLLRAAGPLSRRDIRERTGLGSATVERLTQAMIEGGHVEVAGLDRSSPGRPSSLLRYVSSHRAIAAVDVTEANARGRIVDLAGIVLYESNRPFHFEGADPATARLDGVLDLVDHLIREAPGVQAPIVGIGIALPGITDDGQVTKASELEWRDVPIADILRERTGLPVLAENDANASVYGEYLRGAARGEQSAIALVLGTGIGAGIASEGRIHRGFRSAAGEVGYLLTSTASFSRYFTEHGDAENAIANELAPWVDRTRPHVDRRIGPAFRRMMAAVESGDEQASLARDDFFDHIALVCAAISVVLAPSVIVLAGAFAQYSDLSVEQLSRRLVGRIPSPPRLAASTLRFDAAITGIGELAIERARETTYLV